MRENILLQQEKQKIEPILSNMLKKINNKIFDCLTENASVDKKNHLLHFYMYVKYIIINKFLKREDARFWSNKELHKFASFFEWDVVNVSGWLDMDKQWKRYETYFKNAQNYEITNHEWDCGYKEASKEQKLNLEEDLSKELHEKYDEELANEIFDLLKLDL